MSTLNGSRPTQTATPSRVTSTVRAGLGADSPHRSVMPPIHLSSNYFFEAPGVHGKYDYTRSGNPTRDLAAGAIADLEGGCGAAVTSSGMSAVAVVTRLLSAGDLLMAPRDCYGGSHRLFSAEAERGSYDVRFFDPWEELSFDLARALPPPDDLARDAEQSGPQDHRHRGVGAPCPRHRGDLRGRQHLPFPGEPAAAGAGRGSGRPLHDQVPERAQRRGGRRCNRGRRGAARGRGVVDQRDGACPGRPSTPT